MKTAIILHGKPSKEEYYNPTSPSQSNQHWLPWIQRQLILKGILAQTPELPEPYEPVYEKWCSVFEQFKIDEETILIGHSCGAGFLVRWLSEHKINVSKVILIAPYLDPEDDMKGDFFKFEMDRALSSRAKLVQIIVSNDDESYIHKSVEMIKNGIDNVQVLELTGKGHFTLGDMKTEEFPELLGVVLR